MSGAGPVLEVEGLSKRLGARRVLREVALRCAPGDLLVVVGDNGSGKSTLLRVLSGVVEPDLGRATLGGAALVPGGWRARRQVGYMPDSAAPLPDLQVGELLCLVRALKDAPAPGPLLDRLGVAALLPLRTASLSLGQRRRLCLLLALLGDPPLLLLDEPSDGFDPAGVDTVVSILRERRAAGRAALVTSNDAAFVAALGGRRLRLQDGRLEPVPDAVATRP